MLAGRARSLPDLIVERRDVTDPSLIGNTSPIAPAASSRPGYRLSETIRSSPKVLRRFAEYMTPSMYPDGLLWHPDPVARTPKVGDRVLAFLGVDFQSCRVVPATPSAEAAIRLAPMLARRPDDNYFNYMGRQ